MHAALLVLVAVAAAGAGALRSASPNGVALTPPMGWNSWNHFGCDINCTADPDNCLSERLVMQMADAMVSSGMARVGYQYISLDDCWLLRNRSAAGLLQADPERFPSGIAALAKYVHSKGLKFGLYGDAGTNTCEGYAGSLDHEATDAATLAAWGVDYWKLDGCYLAVADMEYRCAPHLACRARRDTHLPS